MEQQRVGQSTGPRESSSRLAALGIPREQILDDFVHNQAVDVDAAWLAPLFERIDRAGGVEPYLAQHGVAGASIGQLRSLVLVAR